MSVNIPHHWNINETLEIYHEKVRWVALPSRNIQKQKRKLRIRPARAGAPIFRQQTGRRRHQQLIWSKVGQKLWVFVEVFCFIFWRATPGGRGRVHNSLAQNDTAGEAVGVIFSPPFWLHFSLLWGSSIVRAWRIVKKRKSSATKRNVNWQMVQTGSWKWGSQRRDIPIRISTHTHRRAHTDTKKTHSFQASY